MRAVPASSPRLLPLLVAAFLAAGPGSARGQDEPAPLPQESEAAAPVVVPPRLLEPAEPTYPTDAQAQGIEADVVVGIDLDAAGAVVAVGLVKGEGRGFDEAALEAARRLRFAPGTADGAPVAFRVEYTFSFRLARVDRPPELEGVAVLRGTVVDGATLAPLPGAEIAVAGSSTPAAVAGPDGSFELTVSPAAEVGIVVLLEGYRRLAERIGLAAGEAVTVRFALQPRDDAGANVTVVRGRAPWREVERAPLRPSGDPTVASTTLTRRDMDYLPGAMEDVAQAVGRLPGVASDALLGGFWIRGGEVGETRYALDGVTLLDPYHLGGYVSLFNPELIQEAEVWLGAPPATVRTGLSGALEVRYVDGVPRRWDAVVDVSMATVKAHLTGSLGKEGRTTFVVGGRRSYLEAYFGVLQAVGVFPTTFPAPSYGEVYAKVAHRAGEHHRIRAFALVGDSRLKFAPSPEGEDALVQLNTSLSLGGPSAAAALDWRWSGARATSEATLYYQWSRTDEARGGLGQAERSTLHRFGLEEDLEVRASERLGLLAGVTLGGVRASWDGNLPDARHEPTWAAIPWVDLGLPLVDVAPDLLWPEGEAYVEGRARRLLGRLDLRAGLRWTFLGLTGEQLLSPRLGAALALTPTTTLRAGWGIYHQPVIDPILLDPVAGNPDVAAERAMHVVAGFEQWLPWPGLLRVEGYYRLLDRLVVHPDVPSADPEAVHFTNDGTGWAAGFDAVAAARRDRLAVQAGYSLSFSVRRNPLNRVQPVEVPSSHDQRHTIHVQGSVEPHRRVTVALSYDLHSGRPTTPVTWSPNAEGTGYDFTLGQVNSGRYSWFHEMNLRVEHRTEFRRWRLTAYLEVLNLYYARSEFIYIYGDADPSRGEEPERTVFHYLPIRPWLGFRGEF